MDATEAATILTRTILEKLPQFPVAADLAEVSRKTCEVFAVIFRAVADAEAPRGGTCRGAS
jgi:hypothetical protein